MHSVANTVARWVSHCSVSYAVGTMESTVNIFVSDTNTTSYDEEKDNTVAACNDGAALVCECHRYSY